MPGKRGPKPGFKWQSRNREFGVCPSCYAYFVQPLRGTKRKKCTQCAPSSYKYQQTTAKLSEWEKAGEWMTGNLKRLPNNWFVNDRLCRCCNEPFTTNRWRATYCSEDCRLKHQTNPDKSDITRQRRRRASARRRELLRDAEKDGFLREDIFKRDGACVWCGATKNLTIDHIVPLAQGGSHTADNVQAMCFTCNSRKSDKVWPAAE